MKKILFAFIFIFSSQNFLHAQVPGFQGKKFTIYYNASLFTRWRGEGYAADNDTFNETHLNLAHNFSIDVAVSRSIVVGASIKTFKTGLKVFQNDSAVGTYYGQFVEYRFNMRSNWYGIYVKSFRFNSTGCIAPEGPYQKFEMGLGFTKRLDGKITYSENGSLIPGRFKADSLQVQKTSPILGFFYTIGSQHVFNNRFFFNPSVQIGFVPAGLVKVDQLFYTLHYMEGNGDQTTNKGIYNSAVNARMQAYFLMSVNIGIGILLF